MDVKPKRDPMLDVERLIAIEEIKSLRARYCRLVDQRRWEELKTVLAVDAILDLSSATPGTPVVQGAAEIAAFLEHRFRDVPMLLHLNFLPEITIISSTEATALWRQESFFPARFVEGEKHGHAYGFASDSYVREEGTWKIRSIQLTITVVV